MTHVNTNAHRQPEELNYIHTFSDMFSVLDSTELPANPRTGKKAEEVS